MSDVWERADDRLVKTRSDAQPPDASMWRRGLALFGESNAGLTEPDAEDAPVFHIGLHKAGTSWLQDVLVAAPQNNLRMIGPLFAERPDYIAPRDFELDASAVRTKYRALFAKAVAAGEVPLITDERLSGHPCSGGYDSRAIADRIHATPSAHESSSCFVNSDR